MQEILGKIELHFYKLVLAIIILLIGLILGLITRKFLRKVLSELELDKTIKKLGKAYSLEKRLSNLAAYIIYFLTLVLFLNQLGITSIILYILVGILLLLIGVAFLLGVKDLIPNLLGRLLIHRKGYLPGEKIKINGVEGKIKKIGLLEMEIKTKKGEIIYLPNSLLIKSKVWRPP